VEKRPAAKLVLTIDRASMSDELSTEAAKQAFESLGDLLRRIAHVEAIPANSREAQDKRKVKTETGQVGLSGW